ncbi:hypothetical protein HanRHA438_Chr02g0056541 [Helianthus annuus]|nr:hypothetical protein HanRHA438_Chr02g0056541 [Helianthus annuus]
MYWLRRDHSCKKLLATPLGVRSIREGVLVAPTLEDGTPERDGVGVWKVRNSGYVAPIGVLPGVEKEVGIAT